MRPGEPPRRERDDSQIIPRLLLAIWSGGSLLWVVFWVRYFYSYCDFTGTLACAVGGFFETIFYSIPQVLARVLGVPVLVLLAGFAVYRAVKAHRQRRRPGLGARRHSGEQGPLGST
ncbi:MAG TPA: hypothetical protein VFA23_16285 [Dongiaceae bacterium]|nr:hypothetical protein [Dongiaceae bacterium]